ncbi:MAG: Rrf2 family transcriptional regulator [Gemmatimonadota bacterium]|jgi:Rrf2 family protein
MISRTSGYALEALLVIARRNGRMTRATQLADELGIPGNYLSKILNALTRAHILESERGPTGGFRLARSAAEISILDTVSVFEDTGSVRQCLLGRGRCQDDDSCPLHAQWKAVSTPVFDYLRETRLGDLVNGGPGTAPDAGA